MIKPPNFDNWNPAMRGSYMKGRKAFIAGVAAENCPYQDKRKECGRLTWSRAFRAAWQDGYRDEQSDSAITEYYEDRAKSGNAALSS